VAPIVRFKEKPAGMNRRAVFGSAQIICRMQVQQRIMERKTGHSRKAPSGRFFWKSKNPKMKEAAN